MAAPLVGEELKEYQMQSRQKMFESLRPQLQLENIARQQEFFDNRKEMFK